VAEITDVKEEMRKKQEQWLDLIDSKNSEISTLNGRLEEARNSRQSTLDEMKSLSRKYSSSIQEMEEALKTLLKKYQTLQKEKDALVSGQNEAENMLKKSLTEKRRLSSRLEVACTETTQKQKKIEELDVLVTRLEASLSSLDKQVIIVSVIYFIVGSIFIITVCVLKVLNFQFRSLNLSIRPRNMSRMGINTELSAEALRPSVNNWRSANLYWTPPETLS